MILCCIRGMSEEFARDTLRLCEMFRGEGGVVGIDIAGDEGSCNDWSNGEEDL